MSYELKFAEAAQLVASVRMLDERLPRDTKADRRHERPYNLQRMAEQARFLRLLWKEGAPALQWLSTELDRLIASEGRSSMIDDVRKSARKNAAILDASLRTEKQLSPKQYVVNNISPIVSDAAQDFLQKLSYWTPHLTREAHYKWDTENSDRMTAVWGVVADSSSILQAAGKLNWSFLTNAHRAPLCIMAPVSDDEALTIQAEFISIVRDRIGARGTSDVIIRVVIKSYISFTSDVEKLLIYDQHTGSIVEHRLDILAARDRNGRYLRMLNCWMYELSNANGTRSRVAMVDNFEEEKPTFFSAVLSSADVARWQELLEKIDAGD